MNKELFVAIVSFLPTNNLTFQEVLENKNENDLYLYISKSISSFVESVSIRLNDGDPCFLILKKNNVFSSLKLISGSKLVQACFKDIDKKIREIGYESVLDTNSEAFRVAFFTNGREHWDYDFIKLSSHYGGAFAIFGNDNEHSDLIRQIYDNGDLDTGIVSSPENEEYYIGDSAIKSYGLDRSIFEKNFYHLNVLK
jgi:hypothetical protein